MAEVKEKIAKKNWKRWSDDIIVKLVRVDLPKYNHTQTAMLREEDLLWFNEMLSEPCKAGDVVELHLTRIWKLRKVRVVRNSK